MQKIMLYVFPVFFLIGVFNFPIGVLIYWFVSNVWTMGQQFYVIRRNPAPGTPAFDAMEARKREHNLRAGKPADEGLGDAEEGSVATERRPANRQQPKRQSRSTRKTVAPAAGESSVQDTPQDAPKASSNGQQPAKKAAAAKQTSGAKRQPAAKSRAARQAAQKKAAQKKPGGGGSGRS